MQSICVTIHYANNKRENTMSYTCPVCYKESQHAFQCDFINTKPPVDKPLINFPVNYWKCLACGAHFVVEMQEWTPEQFKENCYNASYHLHDGDICNPEGNRILKLVKTLTTQFSSYRKLRHMDYGCGEGYAITKLLKLGWDSQGYDPYHNKVSISDGGFDLITCVEVLEHSYNIHDIFDFFKSRINAHGVIYTTTEVMDPVPNIKTYYYACPRVGHILLHTYRSLDILAEAHGLHCVHLNNSEHLFL